jgi:hypothetical protein
MAILKSLGMKGVPFRTLDIRPDDVDARDYLFSPSLTLLPEFVDPRWDRARIILNQGQEGACVGFALATVINASLIRRTTQNGERESASPAGSPAAQRPPVDPRLLVSPRMLYEMARRYDEWPGQAYEGTSLRGAMKGWHKHGVCSDSLWRYDPAGPPGLLTDPRARDARLRPLGAYYRIADNDVTHLQAAIVEADAVLASAWVHGGWRQERLGQEGKILSIKKIPPESRALGLHAFAIVGYSAEGFIVQNSWSESWGTGGLAILSYEDWMANRQDAWVARPGPETWDHAGTPKIFLDAFMGVDAQPSAPKAGTSGAEGLDLDPAALPFIVNTGDKGALSEDGRLRTAPEDLPQMAVRVRLARPAADGWRHIVLYAHGGLNAEVAGAVTAGRLWRYCQSKGLTAWFFVWETGIAESLLGLLRSRDDAAGPRAGTSFGEIWDRLRKGASRRGKELQRQIGAGLARIVRPGWKEMQGRAQGAARLGAGGGAALFVDELVRTIAAGGPTERYRLHLVGHSAGSIYLGRLYAGYLRKAIEGSGGRLTLGSIRFMAPAITIAEARAIFAPKGELPVLKERFSIWTLAPEDEEEDGIGIYPSSLLTYVADHVESAQKRVPILGIRKDVTKALASLGSPTLRAATTSSRHGEFDDQGHEVETILEEIAAGT